MKIFVSKNLSKNINPVNVYVYQNRFGKKSISQEEFVKITNLMMEGAKCFLEGTEIPQPHKPMPKFGYIMVEVINKEMVPESVYAEMQEKHIRFIDALNNYNDIIKEKINNYIQRRSTFSNNLDVRNDYYKEIQKIAMLKGITAYSPCNKTYYEAKAEISFEDSLPKDTDITEAQIEFVKLNAPKFGLQIPNLSWYYASRKAVKYSNGEIVSDHGYTQEIKRVINVRENYFPDKFDKDYNSAFNPNQLPEAWMVHTSEGTKGQFKETYNMLMWFMNLPLDKQDEFIADGYVRCPHCGQITRKFDDGKDVRCYNCDGLLEEFSVTSNDLLLYGTDINKEFSSLEDLREYYNYEEE